MQRLQQLQAGCDSYQCLVLSASTAVVAVCVQFVLLEGVGHCPQDDRPEVLHQELLPWLKARWQVPVAAQSATS